MVVERFKPSFGDKELEVLSALGCLEGETRGSGEAIPERFGKTH